MTYRQYAVFSKSDNLLHITSDDISNSTILCSGIIFNDKIAETDICQLTSTLDNSSLTQCKIE